MRTSEAARLHILRLRFKYAPPYKQITKLTSVPKSIWYMLEVWENRVNQSVSGALTSLTGITSFGQTKVDFVFTTRASRECGQNVEEGDRVGKRYKNPLHHL